ncbi:MAG: hypothetical protein IKR21_02675, partial [Oscillospiraceae bacterium]|nr:hypothetical protein [Oscillospiraceae bacterium]
AFPGETAKEGLQECLKAAQEAETELKIAESEYSSAKEVYAILSAGYDGDPESVDFSFMTRPLRSRDDTVSALSRAEAQLSAAKAALYRSTGEISALGAPEVISGEIQRIDAEIAEAEEKYEAVELARSLLSEADEEMRTRFSPVISRRAGEILKSLTGGKYERLTFDSAFNAETRKFGDTVGHSSLYASSGTGDQIYLALRLSMCEMLLPGGDCPIILDDALASFDDARAGCALNTLREMARGRQVLLFSCHTREANMLAGAPDVNIVRL